MSNDEKSEKTIESTYELIRKVCPYARIDSLDVVKQVEAYRQFWKPVRTNVILLAESHVYTDDKDFERECNKTYLKAMLPTYPIRFVRFVYCLGYGEETLLNRENGVRANTGTPQFWKIFSSCVSDNPENIDFYKILKTGTPEFTIRINNKVKVLRQMKEKGIWLLDSSLVGLYGNEVKSIPNAYRKIIDICWENYVGKIVEEAKPTVVIVIGKGVEKVLRSRLCFPYEAIDLPQAHQSREKQMRNFRRYSEICTAVLAGKTIPPSTLKTPKTDGMTYVENSPCITMKPVNDSIRATGANAEHKLASLGYRKTRGNEWVKGKYVVHLVKSIEFGNRIRITWKEKWKDHYAVVFDYSGANGPICVVPIPVLFNAGFVKEKRKTQAYVNSKYWWTQTFSEEHELSQIVLNQKSRWEML